MQFGNHQCSSIYIPEIRAGKFYQAVIFFYIQSKKNYYNTYYNYTTYKILYPTTNTIPFGANNYDYLMVT